MNTVESGSPLPSTRPYLIRALHDWCTDNGFTPYLAVQVDATVQVPREYVNNGEIVLNVGFDATSGLRLGNDWIEFKARFGGVARELMIPVDHVLAIYARENGQGMAFPAPEPQPESAEPVPSIHPVSSSGSKDEPPSEPVPPSGPGRPALRRVK
jgi:stringent starvation protein B